ncbi:MAG: N-6 DNA methylase [Verrucomicrobia bacterium]|nr:N-6 DNA methylase [Verrucomicrobiota bacterium]
MLAIRHGGMQHASVSSASSSLADFVTYVQTHLTGDEKGESADFLDRLFRALGHDGIKEAGASHETRLAKKGGAKGKNYADLLWPERVLIEMKSRGKKLERQYDQIFDCWTHIVPHRPPFVILCNFDEFWIYDFNQQLFDPVEKIALVDLPTRAEALAFLLPTPRKPLFNNNRVEVTREAAADLAALFRTLTNRGEDRTRAQRFVLQLLVTLVSEDMHLLPRQILARLTAECREQGASSCDLLGGLFRQMNSQTPARAGRFTDVPYFNGGLFADIDPIELQPAELALLASAADRKWDLVKPEIFGTLFQASMDDGADSGRDERHAFGAHFTSEFDIRKVVGPTIVRPWREQMATAWDRVGTLKEVLRDLRLFRVLDPACGSGNFLYVAFREMKRLEREILLRLSEISKGEPLETAVSIHQFHGLDIQPFAVELAKVTLMLAKEQEVRETVKLHDSDGLLVLEKPLPLDNLDQNIRCADALFTEWPKADAIIGNPPYLGSRYIAQELGYDYAKRVQDRFPGVPKMADFCTHWFRLAHDALPENGRAGLVGTNTIRQNESREASLDYIVRSGGTITDAVSSQSWSGEAQVSVSIVNWSKGDVPGPRILVTQRGDSSESGVDRETLDLIPPTLTSQTDVRGATSLHSCTEPKRVFTGQNPQNVGFMLAPEDAKTLIDEDPKYRDVLHPYMVGDDLVGHNGPTRWVIDFGQTDIFFAMSHPKAFAHVKSHVMPDVLARAEREKSETGKSNTRWTRMAERWWQFREPMPGTMTAIRSVPRYIACARVTKRPIFEFVDPRIHPDGKLCVFIFSDDYSFGVIQSSVHWAWAKARGGTLETRVTYTADSIFSTFPWPQATTRPQLETVAREAVALRQLRRDVMTKMNWSLRDLYRTLDEPGSNPLRDAQARLDSAVRAAYAMPKDADILAFLLDLNQTCAAKEAAGETITPPGLPLPVGEHEKFITSDRIQADL